MTGFRLDGPEDAGVTILLAHGAGAAMESPAMQSIALALAAEGLRVARFEFAYMAGRREGRRAGPPRAETLKGEYRAAIEALAPAGRLVIGGKSMGGRVASMVADAVAPAGLLCIGYPFHPPGRPEELRTAHLAGLATPTLICQGTRDPFGTREEVAGYALSPAIEIAWFEDGDHDLRPRKALTGLTAAAHRQAMAGRVRAWTESL
jgi:predicted alpha/beta-hydrolase family hydrolase